jgi:hypothetical protein
MWLRYFSPEERENDLADSTVIISIIHPALNEAGRSETLISPTSDLPYRLSINLAASASLIFPR